MCGQPSAWAGVGAANEPSNQRRTGSESGSRTDSPVVFAPAPNPSMAPRGQAGGPAADGPRRPPRPATPHRLSASDGEPRVSTSRYRLVWLVLAGAIAAGLLFAPALAAAKPLRAVPAKP